jgi:secreted Zn-dependent insulinase-like peptidase
LKNQGYATELSAGIGEGGNSSNTVNSIFSIDIRLTPSGFSKCETVVEAVFDYKKECFKHFIPHRNYMRILEETNNQVDDLHISEKGHLQLSKDLLNEIKKH